MSPSVQLSRIQRLLTRPAQPNEVVRVRSWLMISMAIALLYALPALQEAFQSPFVIQDDARQHVFWMQRFIDPDLFPNDLIANYFQTVAPAGYTQLYQIAAWFGCDPMLFHKLLPVVLGVVTAGYCFSVCFKLLPVPAAACIATILLGQGLGLTDAIVSATPKAFVYPLMLAFMDAVLRRHRWLTVGAIALQGLFYPQLVFLSSGVLLLKLVQWKRGRLCITDDGGDRTLVFTGLIVAFFILLPYALQSNEFGPTITATEARQLPEFSTLGSRARFFYDDDPATFWLKGRSGLRIATALTPVTNVLGLLLPLMVWWSRAFPLTRQRRDGLAILPQLLISSVFWFGAAHLVLFRLHLPSRYTQHSVRIVLTLAAAIAIVTLIDAVLTWAIAATQTPSFRRSSPIRITLAIGLTGLLTVAVFGYPWFVDTFPITTYQVGRRTELYKVLRSQPKDSLIASLSEEANNIPSFAQRSVVVAQEYGIPYQQGYYSAFRQRIEDMTRAQYSPDIETLQSIIQQYGITHWLLDRHAFDPDYIENRLWVRQYPDILASSLAPLERSSRPPALSARIQSCTMYRGQGVILLEATCLLAEE
ncbi:MAG: hypothetical protein AAGA75_04380 [Cyanobacteria bacterium P01_E01_bin.6]